MSKVDTEKKKDYNYDKVAIIAITILIFGVIVLPIILIQPAFSKFFVMTGKGDIGSVIGGTTAPIIGIITASLMYLAFRIQSIANKRQWDVINLEKEERLMNERINLLWKLYDELKNDFSESGVANEINNILENKIKGSKIIINKEVLLKLSTLLNDLNFLLTVLLGYENRIRIDYGIIFRFKLYNLWEHISLVYNELSERDIKSTLAPKYNKIVENLKKTDEVFNPEKSKI